MNTGNNKILIIIIGFLLLTNVAMLIFFVLPDKSRHRDREWRNKHKSFSEMLKQDVGFTDQQYAQYQDRREQQRQTVRKEFGNIRKLKKNYYDLLFHPAATDSVIHAYGDSLSQKQQWLDSRLFFYFKDLRKIATPEQLPKFDSAVQVTLNRMIGTAPRNRSAGKKASDSKK